MPIARFNYTGRDPITIKIPIHIVSRVFDVDLQNISLLNLPPESLIIIEPHKNVRRLRVPHGTIGNPIVPPKEERDLQEFSVHENIFFRIKIIEKSSGKILAQTIVRPNVEGKPPKRKSLLTVERGNGVEECWRISFEKDDEPELLLDISLGEIEKSEYFLALVYPAALREILAHILLVKKHYHTDDNGRSSQWLRFAKKRDADLPNPDQLDESILTNKTWEWIERVTSRFALQLKSLKKGKSLFVEE